MQIDDDEFVREPLDATKPPLSSSAKEWMGSVFSALSGPRGQRIARRAVLAAGVCALLAITVLAASWHGAFAGCRSRAQGRHTANLGRIGNPASILNAI